MSKKVATFFGGGMGGAGNLKDRSKLKIVDDTNGDSSKEYKDSMAIGMLLVTNGYKIKNGGYYGLMQAVSIGVNKAAGNITGIVCNTFPSTIGNPYLTNKVVAHDIYQRLGLLIENTDLFVVQKGSYGTLSELFLTLDIIRKMKSPPKVILYGDYWEFIFDVLSNYLITEKEKNLVTIVRNMEEFRLVLDSVK
jgi:uncharacterized protein (TIGR00725 family)